MATTPEVQSATLVDEVSSTPTTAEAERSDTAYSPVIFQGGHFVIAPAYAKLSHKKQEYILESARQDLLESAKRFANCFISGSIFARSVNGRWAKGYKLSCGEPFCDNCGLGEYRHRAWMRTRDPEKMYSRRQAGMELGIAMREGESWHDAYARLHYLGRLLAAWTCYRVGSRKTLTPGECNKLVNIVLRNAAPRDGHVYIRVVVVTNGIDCAAVRFQWEGMAKEKDAESASIRFFSPLGVTGQSAKSLQKWVFSGMDEAIKTWTVEQKVTFRKAMQTIPSVDSTGDHYRPLSREEVKARHELERRQRIDTENASGKVQWIYIPYEERVIANCDYFDSEFERVDWSAEFRASYVAYTIECVSDCKSP
jgi:hypothetical protein